MTTSAISSISSSDAVGGLREPLKPHLLYHIRRRLNWYLRLLVAGGADAKQGCEKRAAQFHSSGERSR